MLAALQDLDWRDLVATGFMLLLIYLVFRKKKTTDQKVHDDLDDDWLGL